MFDIPKDHYTARGIAEQVPAELQTFLWEILDREMADTGRSLPEYLDDITHITMLFAEDY